MLQYLVTNKECTLPKRHFQYACDRYFCSHLPDAEVNDLSRVKKLNIDITKNRVNSKKRMSFSDSAA